jgi:hypothetical protein
MDTKKIEKKEDEAGRIDIVGAIGTAELVQRLRDELRAAETRMESDGEEDAGKRDAALEQIEDEFLRNLSPATQSVLLSAMFEDGKREMLEAYERAKGVDIGNLSVERRQEHLRNLAKMRAVSAVVRANLKRSDG